MKRHQILGKELRAPLEEGLRILAMNEQDYVRETSPGQPHQQFTREGRIAETVIYAVLEHLGYGPIDMLSARLDQGVDRAVEYFLGDWWTGDEDDARSLDKSRPDRQLRWFDVLPHALLLGGLTNRWDDVARICSWFDASVEMQYQGGLLEDEYMQMFLCIALTLRPEPATRIDEILAKVKACRTKRPRLLADLWQATVAKDQKAFDKALKASVTHFLKVDAQNVPNVNYWVALHPSFVWLVAERNGLVFPELPEQVDAAVVRRQTIGLA